MTLLTNVVCLGLGLGAGAYLVTPREAINTLRLRVGHLDHEFSRLVDRLSTNRGEANAVADRLESLEKIHTGLTADVLKLAAELNGRLDALESSGTQQRGEDELNLARLDGVTAGMSIRIDGLVDQLKEIKAAVEVQGSQNQAVGSMLSPLQSQLNEQAALGQSLGAKVDELQRALQELMGRLVVPAAAVPPAVQMQPAFNGGVASDLAQLAALQRQAQQAFVGRQQQRQPLEQPGGNGVGL